MKYMCTNISIAHIKHGNILFSFDERSHSVINIDFVSDENFHMNFFVIVHIHQ